MPVQILEGIKWCMIIACATACVVGAVMILWKFIFDEKG